MAQLRPVVSMVDVSSEVAKMTRGETKMGMDASMVEILTCRAATVEGSNPLMELRLALIDARRQVRDWTLSMVSSTWAVVTVVMEPRPEVMPLVPEVKERQAPERREEMLLRPLPKLLVRPARRDADDEKALVLPLAQSLLIPMLRLGRPTSKLTMTLLRELTGLPE